MSDIRWHGYAHSELYEMINAGPGARASDPQTKYWDGLSTELADIDQNLNEKLNKMGAVWEGQAAENAQSGLTPLAQWASDAQTGSSVMGISTQLQADYISDARSGMPEVVEVTTPAPSGWDYAAAGLSALGGDSGPAMQVAQQAADNEAQESAQAEAQEKAVQTMSTYDSSSESNASTLGEFVPPPDVVVDTPAPQGLGSTGTVTLAGTNNSLYSSTGPDGSTSPNSYVPPPNTGGNVPQTGPSLPQGGQTTPQTHLPPYNNPGPVGPNPGPKPIPTPPPNNGPLPPWQTGPGRGPNTGPGRLPGQGPGRNPLFPGQSGTLSPEEARGKAGGLRPGGLPGGGFEGEGRPGSQLRPGGMPGSGMGAAAGENGPVGRGGPGGAGGSGAGGRGGVNGPMGPGGRRGEGEEDDEHFSPDYLLETEAVFGSDQRVAPTVIGEVSQD
jgi:uncharacterized protein YukE